MWRIDVTNPPSPTQYTGQTADAYRRISLLMQNWPAPEYHAKPAGVENQITPANPAHLGAKQSRYQPSPGYAPGGKRRRQWR